MSTQSTIHPAPPFECAGDNDWRPPAGSGFRETVIAALYACLLMAPFLAVGGFIIYTSWRVKEDARLMAIAVAEAHGRLVAAPPAPVLPLAEAIHGRELFASACAACHGPQGTGVEGLGKNLTSSGFVALQSDDRLREFIITGRPDARPVAMPPRAGRDDLSDEDLRHIVVFVRGLQDPRRMPELPVFVASTAPTQAQAAAALAAAGGDEELAEYIASGNALFHSACVACHGNGGVGIPGNGKALVHNAFVRSLDDDALLAFVMQGRSPSDPRNTTGIQMPPKGGNPALSEDDVLDIISYLRTLQGEKPTASTTN